MNPYPSPYSPPPQYPSPNYYAPPPTDPRRFARRAATLMAVLGGLSIVCGICMGGGMWFVLNAANSPEFQTTPQQQQVLQQLKDELAKADVPPGALAVVVAAAFFVPGVVLAVLAVFVRRGEMVSIVLSIVVVGLALLYLIFNFLISLLTAARSPASGAAALCVSGIPLGLFTLLMAWLIQAAKAAPLIRNMETYSQMQYWQYQQQQQAYQQGYGYPTASQYPPQNPPPPPSDSTNG